MAHKPAPDAVARRTGSAETSRETRPSRRTQPKSDSLFLTPALLDAFGETLSQDASWFQDNPPCRYRIRLATAEEAEARRAMGLASPADAVDLTIIQRDRDGTFHSLSITLAQLLAALEWSRWLTREVFERFSREQPLSTADRLSEIGASARPGGEA